MKWWLPLVLPPTTFVANSAAARGTSASVREVNCRRVSSPFFDNCGPSLLRYPPHGHPSTSALRAYSASRRCALTLRAGAARLLCEPALRAYSASRRCAIALRAQRVPFSHCLFRRTARKAIVRLLTVTSFPWGLTDGEQQVVSGRYAIVTTPQMGAHVRCAVSHEHVRHGPVLLYAMFFPNSPGQTTTWLWCVSQK